MTDIDIEAAGGAADRTDASKAGTYVVDFGRCARTPGHHQLRMILLRHTRAVHFRTNPAST